MTMLDAVDDLTEERNSYTVFLANHRVRLVIQRFAEILALL
jgi:hypothetical protein